jgi:hypothetical protein
LRGAQRLNDLNIKNEKSTSLRAKRSNPEDFFHFFSVYFFWIASAFRLAMTNTKKYPAGIEYL